MRKIILGLLMVLLFSESLIAQCDMCGGAGGGSYFGILPQFRKNFVGLRYQNSSFSTQHLPPLLSNEPPTFSQETFNSIELWGRFYPHPRVQVFAFLPYHVMSQRLPAGQAHRQGLGDAMVLANYVLFDTGDSSKTDWKQTVLVGGGVKLPTGSWHREAQSNDAMLTPNLRPGSGSTDFLANMIYTIRYKQAGVNMDMVYRYNTSNPDRYKFGNRLTTSARFFKWFETCDISLLPHAGMTYDYAAMDHTGVYTNPISGGQLLSATLGLDLYFQRWSGGISYTKPLAQNLAGGKITADASINTHLIFMF
ncbi:hypothetical protein RCC89_02520 [Cytophagaceae bacterium ABcell3]|nr:hypothetical protein RCC89_02520 [Cytophagaceae bacterium ABcell3]